MRMRRFRPTVLLGMLAVLLGSHWATPTPALAQRGIPFLGQHQGTWTLVESAPPLVYAVGGGSLIVLDASNPSRPREIGRSAPVLNEPKAMTAAGGIVYVADLHRGLRRFDVRQPSAPRELEPWTGEDRIRLVATDGLRVYAITTRETDEDDLEHSLHVLQPAGIGPLRSLGSAVVPRSSGLAAEDGQVVVTTWSRLLLLDVTNPSAPRIRVDMESPVTFDYWGDGDLWLRDGRLVLVGKRSADGWPAVVVLRIGRGRIDVESADAFLDPPFDRHPPPSLLSVAVDGDRAIALRQDSGGGLDLYATDVLVADIGAGQARWRSQPRPLPHESHDLTVIGDTVLVAAGAGGLLTLDLDAPAAPERGAVDGQGANARAVAVADRLWTINDFERLYVGDPHDAEGAVRRLALNPWVRAIDSDGSRAVAVLGDSRLAILRSDGRLPTASVGLKRPGGIVRVVGNRALIGSSPTLLQVVDLTDPPFGPSLMGSLEADVLPRPNIGVDAIAALEGHAALAVSGQDGPSLQIVNIAAPASMHIVGSLTIPRAVHAMDSDDHHLVLATTDGELRIVDANDPTAPRLIANITLPAAAVGLRVHEGVAYVAGNPKGYGGLWAYDLSSPATPRLLARSAIPNVGWSDSSDVGMAVRDRELFVAAGQAGILRFALLSPADRPIEVYLPRLLLDGGP